MVRRVPEVPNVPGVRAFAFASRWFDPATASRVFEPLVADWQREWQSARPSHRPWIRMRGVAAFAIASFVSSPAILKTAPPASVVARIVGRVVSFVVVVAIVLAIPFMIQYRSLWPAVPQILLTVLPSGIVLAFPFSMLLAVDVIRRARELAPHAARATALKLAVAAVMVIALGHGFVLPAANQQSRLLTTPRGVTPPIPGLRERSTLELLTEEPAAPYMRAGAIRELNHRAVLALMPAIFVWLRWIAHDVRRRRRFWPLPLAAMLIFVILGFFVSYWLGLLTETAWDLKPGTGYWLPIVIATLIGVTTQWITSRRRVRV